MMKRMNQFIGMALIFTLLLGSTSAVFAEAENTSLQPTTAAVVFSSNVAKPSSTKVLVYIKPDLKIFLNGNRQLFKDTSNKIVYPLVYRGSAYLPIRAISSLMDEDIEWDNYSKTVFIGKTLNNPSKSKLKRDLANQNAAQTVESNYLPTVQLNPFTAVVYVRLDIHIMYDFNLETFTDSDKQTIYPIMYDGSIYLPISCISSLMNKPVTWDNVEKTILIGTVNSTQDALAKSQATLTLESKYESTVDLYDQATDKIISIKKSKDADTLNLIATAVADDFSLAQKQTIEIKNMSTEGMTSNEIKAKDALYAFAESSEYYIMVLENIAYLAAEQSDYSMLAETFMDFAVLSRDKMDAARSAIEALDVTGQ